MVKYLRGLVRSWIQARGADGDAWMLVLMLRDKFRSIEWKRMWMGAVWEVSGEERT